MSTSSVRPVRKIITSRPTLEGAGVHLRRAFGSSADAVMFDPFLLLDDFRSDTPDHYLAGFPWHPHRGIETITYMLKGSAEHGDSLGHKGVISKGDVQWMTAGNGIVHQEMPKGDTNGSMWGFQLWANLPRASKMMNPRYRDVKASDIPVVRTKSGCEIKVISGTVEGVTGPVRDIVIEPQYLDVMVPPDTEAGISTRRGHTVFAYVHEGEGSFCSQGTMSRREMSGARYFDIDRNPKTGNHSLVLFDDGDTVQVRAGAKGIRFLLISGKPLREPIAWYGPIVMNTQEELRVAFEEYENGTFLRHTERT